MTGPGDALFGARAKEAGANFSKSPFDDGQLLAGIQQSIRLSKRVYGG